MDDTNEITQLLYRLYERLDAHDFSSFADDAGTRRYEIGEVYEAGVQRLAEGWRLTGFEMRPVWQSGTRPVDGRFDAAE